ncbi:MAG: patatin-like phospholipase family protein [Deltaproteobacteria bacterium]|nr:patatin-like phospholipase family protein [Deltaproteobacteria bacterium]
MANNAQNGRPKRAIVLSGGGARGAYEAGVLQFILDDLPRRKGVEPRFEIVCGTSVGAIHAAFVAATADQEHGRGPRLVKIWEDLHVDEIFRFSPRDLISIPRKLFGVRKVAQQLREGRRPDRLFGLLDTGPLEQLVLDAIPWPGIRRNLDSGHVEAVCIAATQLATGRAVVFVEQKDRALPPWANQDNIRMQGIRLAPVHALASAAIPLLFPAVRVGSRYYADGGMRLNTPLAPAVRLGASRVLVIGLSHGVPPTVSEALAQQRTAGFGNPMFLFGKVLNALMLSPVDADLARMHFINDIISNGEIAFGDDFLETLNAVGVERGGRPIQRIEDMVIRPSRDLGVMAGELIADKASQLELGAFLKMFIRGSGVGGEFKEADLLSYLLFDAAFTIPLAELGYADAMAKEEDLARFFDDDADLGARSQP